MATVFLLAFSRSVIGRLTRDRSLILAPGATEGAAAEFVAEFLGARKPANSLISSLSAALLACPEVEEVYIDDDELKAVVDDVPRADLPV